MSLFYSTVKKKTFLAAPSCVLTEFSECKFHFVARQIQKQGNLHKKFPSRTSQLPFDMLIRLLFVDIHSDIKCFDIFCGLLASEEEKIITYQGGWWAGGGRGKCRAGNINSPKVTLRMIEKGQDFRPRPSVGSPRRCSRHSHPRRSSRLPARKSDARSWWAANCAK